MKRLALSLMIIMIAQGCSNPKDKLLFSAIDQGNQPAVDKLVKDGAKVNSLQDGMTPLITAIARNEEEIARILLINGADPNMASGKLTPLMAMLAVKGSSNLLLPLIEYGADLDADLKDIDQNMRGNMFLLLIKSGRYYGDDIIKIINQPGFDVRIDMPDLGGNTPLMHALAWESFELAEVLVRMGANVNQINSEGSSPLHEAIYRGAGLELVKVIVESGAHIDYRDKENGGSAIESAMHYYIRDSLTYSECKDIINYLIDKEVNLNPDRGYSAFSMAVINEEFDIAERILESNYDINQNEFDGRRVLQIAREEKLSKVESWLVSHGAN